MLEAPQHIPDGDWLSQAQARFDNLNDDAGQGTCELLNRIVPQPALHARFLNTLSLLEHMGSYKIMSTQHSTGIEQATLRHVTEECHHAFFMKRHAEKTAERPLEYQEADLLSAGAARMYFQRLEASMIRSLSDKRDPRTIYLYMSMIIEFRAVWFYTLYQQCLARCQHPLSLKRLLGEEQNHLTDMAERLDQAGELSDNRVDHFIDIEHRLYGRLLDALRRATA